MLMWGFPASRQSISTPQTDQATAASSSLLGHVMSQKDYMAMHGFKAPPAAVQAWPPMHFRERLIL
jgi:hypothetical protein